MLANIDIKCLWFLYTTETNNAKIIFPPSILGGCGNKEGSFSTLKVEHRRQVPLLLMHPSSTQSKIKNDRYRLCLLNLLNDPMSGLLEGGEIQMCEVPEQI